MIMKGIFRSSIALLFLALLTIHPIVALPDEGGKPAEHNPKIDSALEQILQMAATGMSVSAMDLASRAGVPAQGGSIKVVLELAPQFRGPLAQAVVAAVNQAAPGLVVASSESFVKLRLPLNPVVLSILDLILQMSGVAYVRPPAVPQALAVSEGVGLTGASSYQANGLRGQGGTIAVIDLGFQGLAAAQARGELPGSVQKIDYTGTGLESGANHGTAVAEIVHDMAPDAGLYLMKVGDEVDLERAKDDAIRYGIKIINHSVGWFNTNFYDGRGAVAEIAADARAHGILWINAAGNYAKKHWKGYGRDNDRDSWCEFSGNDEDLEIQVRGGDPVQLYLTWNDWPRSAQDYDLYLYDSSGRQVALSDRLQTGTEEPIEQISYRAPSSGTYRIKVKAYHITSGRELALFSLDHDLEHAVPQASIVAPGNSSAVVTVGAINYANWTSGPAEPYSSQGPTGDGRTKPDLVAPDRVLTATLGRFGGTSAAAPHVAGAAALLLSENPSNSAGQLESNLKAQAIAMGSALVYGAGRLNLAPQIVQRPDLTITNVDYSPRNPTIGSQLNFTIQVKNRGNGAAGGFTVEIRDSLGRKQQAVSGLAPGQTTQISFARRIDRASETYTFTADSLNQVAESDEGNNTAELRVTAGSQPPPPPTAPTIEIWTDKSNYRLGERLTLGFESHPRAYVYIYDIDPTGQIFQIFPNSFSRNNYIEGRHTLPDGPYVLTISGPAGREYLQAVASNSPIELGLNGLRNPSLLDPEAFRSEVARRLGTSSGWAVDWTSFQVGSSAPPSNRPPVASFSFSPTNPTVGNMVTFDSSGSRDPDGRITNYQWDFNGDGRTDATGVATTYSFPTAGSYRVTLTVIDDGGLSSSAARTVQVGPGTVAPPSLPIATLSIDRGCGATYRPGERMVISFSVSESATIKLFDFTTSGQMVQLLERSVAASQQGSMAGQVVGPSGAETLVLFARTTSGTITTAACSFTIGSPGGTATLSIDRGPGGSYRPGEPIRFSYSVSEEASLVIYDFEPTGAIKPIGLGRIGAGERHSFNATVVGPPGVETAVLMAYTRSGKVLTAAVSFNVVP